MEEGLVFGPVNNATLQSLLLFCFIGTIVSGVDTANRLHDVLTGKPFVNLGYTEVRVLFFEDIPQMTISFSVLLCNKEVASLLTFIRAVIVMYGPLLSSYLLMRDRKLNKKLPDDKKKRCIRGIFTGYVIVSILSILTYICVGISWETGSWNYGRPSFHDNLSNESYMLNMSNQYNNTQNLTSKPVSIDHRRRLEYVYESYETYSNRMYFTDVGIFLHTGDLPYPKDEFGETEWIKLFSINEIHNYSEIHVTTEVETNLGHIRIRKFYTKLHMSASDICYQNGMNKTYYEFSKVADCSFTTGTKFHYHFKYLSRSARHVRGDIEYNVRKTRIYSCNSIAVRRLPNLKYFKEKYADFNDDETKHFYGDSSGNETTYKFFPEWYLKDIKDAWRTRIDPLEQFLYDINLQLVEPYYCEFTGSIGPHFNPDIPVPCQI